MPTENKTPENGEENTDVVENDDAPVEVTEEALLDVISEAVDEATPDDVLALNKPEGENDDDDTGTDGKPAADAETAEKDGDEANAESESESAASEKPGDSDESAAGDKPAADKDATAATAEKDGDKSADSAADNKTGDDKDGDKEGDDAEVDHINDPIAEGTNEKTAARIQSLIGITKEATGRAEERDELITQITDTGADATQYSNTLGFLKLYNSGDVKDRQQALEVAEGIVRELQVVLGVGTVDLLESHADLKAEVEAGTITEPRAIEVATSREQKVLSDARTEAADAATTADEQTLALITTGKEQLNVLETTLKTSDPDYARLRPLFIGVLKPALREAHPTKWGEIAQTMYQQIKTANPAPAEPAPKPTPETPLRPRGSGGGSADKEGEPDTALAAINAALGSM